MSVKKVKNKEHSEFAQGEYWLKAASESLKLSVTCPNDEVTDTLISSRKFFDNAIEHFKLARKYRDDESTRF